MLPRRLRGGPGDGFGLGRHPLLRQPPWLSGARRGDCRPLAAGRRGVQVDAWNAQTQTIERWHCDRCIVVLPGFVAARVIEHPPEALRKLAERIRYAPWAVVNLHLHRPGTGR
jgi:hypothetical protein